MPVRASRLIAAHADLESITLERDLAREKQRLETGTPSSSTTACGSRRCGRRWTRSSTRASGSSPARCACTSSPAPARSTGRRSEHSLYDYGLATYDAADVFRHEDSAGFVRLWGLGLETWAAKQGSSTTHDRRERSDGQRA